MNLINTRFSQIETPVLLDCFLRREEEVEYDDKSEEAA